MRPLKTLRKALHDRRLLGTVMAGPSWRNWRIALIAANGEPLDPEELELFKSFSGGKEPPDSPVDEFVACVGRRGGKDVGASVLAVYRATCFDYRDVLAPGEVPTVVCLGADQHQATIQRNYIEGALRSSPVLAELIASTTADSVTLTNGVVIQVRAASFRRIRGVTAVAVIATETAFWRSEDSAEPDSEILAAVRPALATTRGPLVMISSPYSKSGELWETYRRHFGPDGDPRILVINGTSAQFNPTLDPAIIDRALQRDPAAARAEYLAEFRDDISAFISREVVEGCVEKGIYERAPNYRKTYYGFVDVSGGVSDSTCAAVAHLDGEQIVIDVLREFKSPHDPETVTDQLATLFKAYNLRTITGDRFGAEWVRSSFSRRGIELTPAERPKSQLYAELLPHLSAKTVTLLDDPRSIAQLVSLERRTSRAGRDIIDHGPGGKDDLSNVIAGVVAVIGQPSRGQYAVFHYNPFSGRVYLPDEERPRDRCFTENGILKIRPPKKRDDDPPQYGATYAKI